MLNKETILNSFFQKVSLRQTEGLSVYMLGIGGIGMSALARYFVSRGVKVSGYDRTATALTRQLEEEGMHIHYVDDVQQIDKDCSLFIYTPAVPDDLMEKKWMLESEKPSLKRSEALGWITKSSFNVCVAGTHGKTTTSTMIAHLLRDAGDGCNAFLGGISSNYGSNFWSSETDVCVLEADEYDRSFLRLSPNVTVITAVDADHLDIYGSQESFQQAFVEFSAKLKPKGRLYVKNGLPIGIHREDVSLIRYGLVDETADVYAKDIRVENGAYVFTLKYKQHQVEDMRLNMGGLHNIENALVAFSVVMDMGVEVKLIREALASFRGVHRRFEYVIQSENKVLIDDYAHHPQELHMLIESVKQLYPYKKCLLIFQPHLYSRTRDFADGFAEVMSRADETWLLPIYPARELPIVGVSSEMIAEKMDSATTKCLSKAEMLKAVKQVGEDTVVVMAGAGDIDVLVTNVKEQML